MDNQEERLIKMRVDAIEVPKPLTKLDILKKISSGTELRNGINDIVNGGMGAIIVVANPKVYEIFLGGFKVNCKFNSKRLFELTKMDGAIILSEDFKKILYANTLLIPDSTLPSSETGIRHQAAERTAKQTGTLVITISQRRGEIIIYYGNHKYVLQPTEDLLRRATETLQILEKQKEIFNELLLNLNVLELTGLVSIGDICKILQRIEMIKKIESIINEYLVELGKDGAILKMRMREIMRGIEKEDDLIMKDYIPYPLKTKQFFESLNFEEILNLENISIALFHQPLDKETIPKGYRLLDKTSLAKEKIENLAKELGNLKNILDADDETLINAVGVDAELFKKNISNLREKILVGKMI